MTSRLQSPNWTFLSNHSHVLYCISLRPDIRIRDIAEQVQITDRAVQRIVVDLEEGGYLKRERIGRQNRYRLKSGLRLRHPLEDHVKVARLLGILQPGGEDSRRVSRDSTGAARRELKTAPRRAHARAASRLLQRPKKRRKQIARPSK